MSGANFAAGMTGGMAFVYDRDGLFAGMVNTETVVMQRLASEHWEQRLRDLVAEHARETQSVYAAQILREWDLQIGRFWQVCPREMIERLDWPLDDGRQQRTA